MTCIDFDAYFTDYLNAWVEKNAGRFQRPEDMEDEMPSVYLRFLNTPASWLDGVTPGAYFDRYSDARELTDLLVAYVKEPDCSVPDPLLERLAELADDRPLLALAQDASAPIEARMLAVDLLRQLDSAAPMVDYLHWQVERNQPEELLDNALESLRCMGQSVYGPTKIAFTAADDAGKEALLDVLCEGPADEDVFAFALRSFETRKQQRALFAGYLAKLDDDRALEALLDVAESGDVSYIDFIEIRSAIERLGGEAPVRDFSRDPTYQAMKRLQ